jgi:hypothetical protein
MLGSNAVELLRGRPMSSYLRNRWIRVGLILILAGWGPLFAVIFLAKAGLLSDPNPNPVGPGILFFLTFWPAIICLAVGVVQTKRQGADSPLTPEQSVAETNWLEVFFQLPLIRLLVGLLGIALVAYGLRHLSDPPGSRGGAGALVLAAVALYWAFTARIPNWFGRN